MGWETRSGRKYYYRKVREGGKVRSVYVGSDPAQAWYAESQLRARRKRDVQTLSRWLAPQARRNLDQFDREVTLACEMICRVTEAALQEAGYHQHKGEWRRDLDASDSPDDHDGPHEGRGEKDGDDRVGGEAGAGDIYVVLHKAADPRTRREWEPVFRALLQDHPELWRDANGPAHQAALEALRQGRACVAARQLPHDSTLVLDLANLQAELHYDAAQGLERLLIEAVLLTFLRQRALQAYYGEARVTIALANRTAEWEQRVSRAQRAYERARRGLARVRGLAARRRRPLRITD